ncbi:MAG TPA: hypothetical protein VD994_11875 [Prosthecobacter sp.]|nr:hypothetical protein [Prosthecobacter sp.]
MQVSWINPEDVASLAESLRTPPPAKAEAGAGLPLLEAEDMAALAEALEGFRVEIEEEKPAAEAPREAPPDQEDEQEPVPSVAERPPHAEMAGGTDLNALRRRLQEIRERAVDAGLLPAPQAVEPPATPKLVEEPVSEAAPEDGAPQAIEQAKAPVIVFEVPLGSVTARLEAFAMWAHECVGTDQIFVVDDRGDLLWGPQDQAGLILSTLMAVNAAARASARSACGGAQALHQALPSGMMATILGCETRLGLIQVAVAAAHELTADEAEAVRGALTAAINGEA